MEKWCYWHIKTKEDTKDTWTCTAHMGDGRAFECPYKSPEDSQDREYPCEDYKLGEHLTKQVKHVTTGRFSCKAEN